MAYEDLDEHGKALADAFHTTDDAVEKAVLNGLFGAHTNSGGGFPPPPPPKQ